MVVLQEPQMLLLQVQQSAAAHPGIDSSGADVSDIVLDITYNNVVKVALSRQ